MEERQGMENGGRTIMVTTGWMKKMRVSSGEDVITMREGGVW
jgi:hypothetical protein